jgi:methyl-accepting chemotaxis protein
MTSATTRTKAKSPAEVHKLVQREALLEQLQPVEEIVEAARREIAEQEVACRAAKAKGKVDPGQLAEATAAAEGVDELIRRFDSMAYEIAGHSRTVDEALQHMSDTLAALRTQTEAVVEQLHELTGASVAPRTASPNEEQVTEAHFQRMAT